MSTTTSQDPDLREIAVGIALYMVVFQLRPSWINRHLKLSFAQHFQRLFLTRGLAVVAGHYLQGFNERSEKARVHLRDELRREPTLVELVTKINE